MSLSSALSPEYFIAHSSNMWYVVVRLPLSSQHRDMAFLTQISSPLHLASTASLLQVGASHAGRSLSRSRGRTMKGVRPLHVQSTTSTRVGLRTFLEGQKDGPTIIFVHGWPDDHWMWDKQVCRVTWMTQTSFSSYAHVHI